jgi:uncharacterized protein YdeI (YjbR/CyaY-like superfamily)
MAAATSKELKVMRFASAKAFNVWIKKHHAKSPGIWIRFYKKGSGTKTITYAEALDEALCYGWIDSQARSSTRIRFILERWNLLRLAV